MYVAADEELSLMCVGYCGGLYVQRRRMVELLNNIRSTPNNHRMLGLYVML